MNILQKALYKLGSSAAGGFMAAGYDAAVRTRLRRDLPYGRQTNRDEDSMIGRTDRNYLLQRCLDLRRNDALTQGIVNRFPDNVVGAGINPQCKTGDTAWDNEAESYWREWSKIADSRGRVNLSMIQRMSVQMRLLTGDMGFILTSGGQIQPIESQRIATPVTVTSGMVVDGIKIDPKTGRHLGYYVFQRNAQGVVDTSSKDFEYIRAEDMIFISAPLRFDQVRGIPDFAPVVCDIQDIKEICGAVLQKTKSDAMHAWATYTETGMGIGNMGGRGVDPTAGATTYEKFEDGMNYYLRPGEKIESLASNTPNSQFMPYMEFNLRKIGSCLGLPYEFTLLDFSKGSYSSSRAALLQTYRTFDTWQQWLRDSLLQRLWNWRIAKAIKAKELAPAPMVNGVSQWYKVDWQFPEFGWVDPQNESVAGKMDYQMGTTTLSSIIRKKGRDAEDVFSEKANEIAMAQRIADDLNSKNKGLNLTWRDIINVETVANQKAAQNSAVKPDAPDMEDDTEDESDKVTK